jgi:hypothetical protein
MGQYYLVETYTDEIKLVITGTNPSAALVNMYRKEDWSAKVINMNATHLSKQHSLEIPLYIAQ